MKLIFILIAQFTFETSYATTYYLSSVLGQDNYTNIQAQRPATPWKTVDKLNAFNNLQPGDSVLFKRGENFYGNLIVKASGTQGNPIFYGPYGTGTNPVITGFTNVPTWVNLGSNIWESTSAISSLDYTNMVSINGVNTPMGRFPNTGYFTFQSHSGTTSLTSSSLRGIVNWKGGELVVRTKDYYLDRMRITSQSGSTLSYSTAISGSSPTNITSTPVDGYGFFIQNDVRTLDSQNEWYYNPNSRKIRIYSTSQPSNVQVAAQSTLITVAGNYITFSGLSFTGADYGILSYTGVTNLSIQNCSLNYFGIDAVFVGNCNNLNLTNNTITDSNNDGIFLFGTSKNAIVRSNAVQNTAVYAGMGQNGSGTYSAIWSSGNGLIAEYNKITNTGYIGLFFTGDATLVNNNFIDTFCTVLQDGAGIYTIGTNSNRTITGNIVLNGIGNISGSNSTDLLAEGIYLDDGSNQVEVSVNTVANCSDNGIFLHNASRNDIHNNTLYNNLVQLKFQQDDDGNRIRKNTINNNIIVSKLQNQWTVAYTNYLSFPVDSLGTADSNYYARPVDDNLTFGVYQHFNNYISNSYNLTQWQTYSGLDASSKKSPKAVTDVDDLRLEYNATSSNKIISLGATYIYIDVTGKSYQGTITLTPYSSIVMIKCIFRGKLTIVPG